MIAVIFTILANSVAFFFCVFRTAPALKVPARRKCLQFYTMCGARGQRRAKALGPGIDFEDCLSSSSPVSSSEAVRLLSPQLPNRTADRFGGGLLL